MITLKKLLQIVRPNRKILLLLEENGKTLSFGPNVFWFFRDHLPKYQSAQVLEIDFMTKNILMVKALMGDDR